MSGSGPGPGPGWVTAGYTSECDGELGVRVQAWGCRNPSFFGSSAVLGHVCSPLGVCFVYCQQGSGCRSVTLNNSQCLLSLILLRLKFEHSKTCMFLKVSFDFNEFGLVFFIRPA